MKLSELKKIYPDLKYTTDRDLKPEQLKRSNRDFRAGDIFVAVAGNTWDGHSFLPEAAKSASLLVYEDPSFDPQACKLTELPATLKVMDSRLALANLANLLEGKPAKEMFCVGVTGTNGKTSTVSFLEQIFLSNSHKVGVMGTIDHHLGDFVWPTELTSPGPIDFYRRLSQMKEKEADSICVEVSSHALDQKRFAGFDLDVGVFTNLSQDHLDYHKTMEEYFLAKEKILSDLLMNSHKNKKFLVLNAEDAYSSSFQTRSDQIKIIRMGKSLDCDYILSDIKLSFEGIEFQLKTRQEEQVFKAKLLGEHNVFNLALAIVVANLRGQSLSQISSVCGQIHGAKGRLDRVENSEGIHVFVDFAHSPDGLINIGKFLNQLKEASEEDVSIHSVFGAGGDRDKAKRPLMGSAVEDFSDYIYITSDNPRGEDPMQIINEIRVGISRDKNIEMNADRESSIRSALLKAKKGDVVLIAGKGHEEYQEMKGIKKEYSDYTVVKNFFKESK